MSSLLAPVQICPASEPYPITLCYQNLYPFCVGEYPIEAHTRIKFPRNSQCEQSRDTQTPSDEQYIYSHSLKPLEFRGLKIEDLKWHSIEKIGSNQNDILPVGFWQIHGKHKRSCHFFKMPNFPFSYPICVLMQGLIVSDYPLNFDKHQIFCSCIICHCQIFILASN